MCTNGPQVSCEVPSLPNPTTRKGWSHHRGLRPLLFSNSDVGSFTSHKNKSVKVLWDGTYGFSSLSEKTRKSNHLQLMPLQRQHFLLSYLKGLCHCSPVHFANYSPSIAMELKVIKEITSKRQHQRSETNKYVSWALFLKLQAAGTNFEKLLGRTVFKNPNFNPFQSSSVLPIRGICCFCYVILTFL